VVRQSLDLPGVSPFYQPRVSLRRLEDSITGNTFMAGLETLLRDSGPWRGEVENASKHFGTIQVSSRATQLGTSWPPGWASPAPPPGTTNPSEHLSPPPPPPCPPLQPTAPSTNNSSPLSAPPPHAAASPRPPPPGNPRSLPYLRLPHPLRHLLHRGCLGTTAKA